MSPSASRATYGERHVQCGGICEAIQVPSFLAHHVAQSMDAQSLACKRNDGYSGITQHVKIFRESRLEDRSEISSGRHDGFARFGISAKFQLVYGWASSPCSNVVQHRPCTSE